MFRLVPLIVGVLVASSPGLRADPVVRGVVDIGNDRAAIKGALGFDLAGGPIQGTIEIKSIAYPPDAPLKLADGREVGGTLSATLTFTGDHPGGALGNPRGKVILKGTFRRVDTDVSGKVSGEGEWVGDSDALLGTLTLDAYWAGLKYEGGGIAPEGEMSLTLPPLRYEPLMNFPAETPSHAEATQDAEATGGPVPSTGRLGWVLAVGTALVLVGTGIVLGKWRFGGKGSPTIGPPGSRFEPGPNPARDRPQSAPAA